jgi:hypothetical protein
MATKEKAPAAPKTETPKDYSKVYVCIWLDAKGTPQAFGADCDKATAKKIAGKACAKYEKKNGNPELPNFAVHVVSLAK